MRRGPLTATCLLIYLLTSCTRSTRMATAVVAMFCCLMLFSASTDCSPVQTLLTPLAAGSAVVEAVCDLIEASCIFPDDRRFTRRLAYVESTDGADPTTFRNGYYGGIWQVDEDMFLATQSPAGVRQLAQNLTAINVTFKVDWSKLTWTNLTTPLYSALAARLYLVYSAGSQPVPQTIADQARYWTTLYRPNGRASSFVNAAERLEKGCSSAIGADVIFVLDASGSISSSDYAKMKSFVGDVIRSFNVSPNLTRVGLIKFSDVVTQSFHLNTYQSKGDMLAAVNSLGHDASGTNTHLALDLLVDVAFAPTHGARVGHPHVAIVITDGASNVHELTLIAARRLHAASVTTIAVGIGSSLNMVELRAIASQPVCQHVKLLTGFFEIDSIKYLIEKRTCEAPVIMAAAENTTTSVAMSLASGAEQNCKMKVNAGGATVAVTTQSGSTTFYTATLTYPRSSYYDQKVTSKPGHRGILYVPHPSGTSGLQEAVVFCSIEGDENMASNVTVAVATAVDKDECATLRPCENGAKCHDLGHGWRCDCQRGWTGINCDEGVPVWSSVSLSSSSRTLLQRSLFVVLIGLCVGLQP